MPFYFFLTVVKKKIIKTILRFVFEMAEMSPNIANCCEFLGATGGVWTLLLSSGSHRSCVWRLLRPGSDERIRMCPSRPVQCSSVENTSPFPVYVSRKVHLGEPVGGALWLLGTRLFSAFLQHL